MESGKGEILKTAKLFNQYLKQLIWLCEEKLYYWVDNRTASYQYMVYGVCVEVFMSARCVCML